MRLVSAASPPCIVPTKAPPGQMAFVAWTFAIAFVCPGFIRAQSIEVDADQSRQAVAELELWLKSQESQPPDLAAQPFAQVALTAQDAGKAAEQLVRVRQQAIRRKRAAEMERNELQLAGQRMKFTVVRFPKDAPLTEPVQERPPLFISLHGGGGAPAEVNDSQWQNQIKLAEVYRSPGAVYVAPRAPSDAWDMWHQAPIDDFLVRLIENLTVFVEIDPNRVYLLGYSAGGDGVYQVAPRLADRFAAAAMMAGHPNEASPLGLRNLPFAIHVGALDDAYGRNRVAGEWGQRLDELERGDPEGYAHLANLHDGKGHWMDTLDREAIPWLLQYVRDPAPRRVVWFQDDVVHPRFYWLAVPSDQARAGQQIIAECVGQEIRLQASPGAKVTIRLNERLLDLDQRVVVVADGQRLFEGPVFRTVANLAATLEQSADAGLAFPAEVSVELAGPAQ